MVTAKNYPNELAKLIQEDRYTPDQIFSADETALFWKQMPKKTFLAKSQKTAGGFKATKDRMNLVVCTNTSGDKMLKPLLINNSLMPRALKGIDIKQLSVHFMANKKASMIANLLKD